MNFNCFVSDICRNGYIEILLDYWFDVILDNTYTVKKACIIILLQLVLNGLSIGSIDLHHELALEFDETIRAE